MAETWFDTDTGAVFSLLPGAEKHQQQFPPSVQRLHELLLTESFPFKQGDFEPIYTRRAFSDAYKVQLADFALEVLAESDEDIELLYRPHIERLNILGIMPRAKNFYPRDQYFDALSSKNSPSHEVANPDRYANWTPNDFAKLAEELAETLGRRPGQRDFKEHTGITPTMLTRRAGGLQNIYNLNGWFEPRTASKQAFIDWGIEYAEINGLEWLAPDAINIISARNAGPSKSGAQLKFGSWWNFTVEVRDQYNAYTNELANWRQQKVDCYKMYVAEEILPTECGSLDDHQLLVKGGIYELLSAVAPTLAPEQKIALVMGSVSNVTKKLRQHHKSITREYLESQALSLGVLDDLWPIDHFDNLLRLTPEDKLQLQTQRREAAARYKKWRARQSKAS